MLAGRPWGPEPHPNAKGAVAELARSVDANGGRPVPEVVGEL